MPFLSRPRFLATLLACAPAGAALPALAQSRAPYLIGAVLTLSGDESAAGLSSAAGLDAAVRHLNAAGGIGGRPLEVRVLDDGGNAERAVEELKRFSNDAEVVAVIGSSQRSTATALENAANDGAVPFFSLAPRQSAGGPLLPWVFRVAVPEPTRIGLLIDYAKRHALSPLAVVFSDDPYGRDAAKIGSALAASAGLTVVSNEPLAADVRNDAGYVVRAKSKGTQTFLTFVSERRPIDLAKALAAHAPGAAALSDMPADTTEFLRAAGREANYWRVAAPKVAVARLVSPNDPLRAAIVDFAKLYPPYVQPDAIAASARDALVMLSGVLGTTGPDRTKIRTALESGKEFVGAMGVYRMTAADHGAVDAQGLTLIEGGGGVWKRAD
jgi:branched-chain amino acid transport system substrate-binding protein